MATEDELRKQVDQFIHDEIDSVPHLEALLLIWTRRPKRWSVEEMAHALYVEPAVAEKILHELANRSLITIGSGSGSAYYNESEPNSRDQLIDAVERIYRLEIVRISTMIHAKASPSVRDFARAFRFTKERDQ